MSEEQQTIEDKALEIVNAERAELPGEDGKPLLSIYSLEDHGVAYYIELAHKALGIPLPQWEPSGAEIEAAAHAWAKQADGFEGDFHPEYVKRAMHQCARAALKAAHKAQHDG